MGEPFQSGLGLERLYGPILAQVQGLVGYFPVGKSLATIPLWSWELSLQLLGMSEKPGLAGGAPGAGPSRSCVSKSQVQPQEISMARVV